MRLIDADAFLEERCRDCKYRRSGICEEIDPICSTVDGLMNAPTVDAVEVVRCKDCRFCEIVDETQRYFCRKPLGAIGYIPVEPDDFCSYAEKRGSK